MDHPVQNSINDVELTILGPHGDVDVLLVGLVAAVAQHPQLEHLLELVGGDPQGSQDHHAEPVCYMRKS